ncbi:TPA: LexA family transcriptional regulator [Pasteurella multocida]|nr:helix-turn-helix transcriptional regulator [Pasteurella multocida subsp. multocida]
MSKPNIYDLGFAKRMEVLVERYGGSIASLAQKLEVSPPTIARWIKGEADPTRSNLIKIAQTTNVSLEWLALGIGDQKEFPVEITEPQQNDNFELIDDFRNVRVSAGFGAFNGDNQAPKKISIEKAWFHARHLKPKDCAMFLVNGDSMYPTLKDGEEIIVDRSKRELDEGKIFVINHQGAMWVKKVRFNFNGIDLISDNSTYNPISLTTEEANSLLIIGQVVRSHRNF